MSRLSAGLSARVSAKVVPLAVAGGTALCLGFGTLLFDGQEPITGQAVAAQVVTVQAGTAAGGYLADAAPQAAPPPAAPPAVPAAPEQPAQPAPEAQPEPGPAKPPAAQRPGTIRLAKGGTATLVRAELGPDAVLPVPDGVREATWWGAAFDAPTGASVLAGHVNWKGRTGPFAELWNARTGDSVSIVDSSGRTLRFRVTDVVTVAKNDLPGRAEELFGQRGPHRLVLVTCGGQWVGGEQGYESNRVVIASPE